VIGLAGGIAAVGRLEVEAAAAVPAHAERDLGLAAGGALAVGVEDLGEAGRGDAAQRDPLGGGDDLAGVQRVRRVVVEVGDEQMRRGEHHDGEVPAHLGAVEGGLGAHQVGEHGSPAQGARDAP
jgi:hypothetical protein